MANNAVTEYTGSGDRKFNLRDLLVVLFRRRWIVLGVSIPIIIFGFYGTLTTVDTFTAVSQVLIEARSVQDPSFQMRPVVEDVLMSTAAQIAQSIPVATKAAEALMDSLPRLKRDDPRFADVQDVDEIRDAILFSVSCDQVGESNLLSIRFTDENPDFAVMVVEALTEAYISYNIEKGQNTPAIEYYTEQISETESEIMALMANRVEIFDDSGMNAFKMNNEAGIQQMRSLEASYHKAHSQRMGLEDRLNGVRRAVAESTDYMPAVSASGKHDNLTVARAELDEALRNLARLRLSYQDSSQHVIRQRQFVEDAREIFMAVRADYVRDLEIELEATRSEELALAESLREYEADLVAYPALEKELYLIDLNIEAKKDLLEALQTKRGEVRLKVQGDQRISNITRLNEPSIEMGVGGGKKFLYLMVAVIFALALGIVVALLVDMQDHRIFDRRQAESVLELPVLGAISPAQQVSEKR